MILLTSTSDLLKVVTGSALNTDVHASWVDNAAGVITPGRTNTAITTATTTTVVGSPAASTQRNVVSLTVTNKDAASSQAVTLKHTDGATEVQVVKVTLLAGEALVYSGDDGFQVVEANGSIKTGVTGPTGATGATGATGGQGPEGNASSVPVDLLHVDADTGHRDLIASGWMPALFNQQWGGAPHYFELVDGATGVPYKFEAASQNVEQNTLSNTGSAASVTWQAQGFKVSVTQSIPAIWVKIYKVGNPANNLEMRIIADDGSGTKPTGSTAITNGTATAQSGKLHSSDGNGQWVRFVFATPCALTANTFYHITLKSSGAVDASNYWAWTTNSAGKYPHGNNAQGDATPTWTANAGNDCSFLIESPAAAQSLQSGGTFSDGKLVFFEGSPLNQSNGRVKDLKNFSGLDLTDFTLLVRGSAWTKDKTILDIGYGMDHDRIVLRSAVTTGYPTLTVYESDGSVHTVTGTTDVSSGDHDIAIRVRAKNDGSDAVQLWVAGASQGTPIASASIAFDTLFGLAQLGTAWIGGGFALAPTWSGSSISTFSGLPSTLGWTYNGVATEANAYSVSGGKLYQNKNGAGANTHYYTKNSAGFTNANGSSLVGKFSINSAANTPANGIAHFSMLDGTRDFENTFTEYFNDTYSNGWVTNYVQHDYKSNENVIHSVMKLTDAYMFVNHRLLRDFTGQLGTTATNQIAVGSTTSAGADSVHSYWKYYTTAALLPQFTSGSLSEFAIWSGDKTSILATLYNSGAEISVKQFCGVQKNYVGEGVVQRLKQNVITNNTSYASAPFVLIPEFEGFVVGSLVEMNLMLYSSIVAGSGYTQTNVYVDGAEDPGSSDTTVGFGTATNPYQTTTYPPIARPVPFGLHKCEARWGSAGTSVRAQGQFGVEAK